MQHILTATSILFLCSDTVKEPVSSHIRVSKQTILLHWKDIYYTGAMTYLYLEHIWNNKWVNK